jgi:hypothetical protein
MDLRTRARELLLTSLLLVAGSLAGLLMLELALRLLPINGGLMAAKVDAEHPAFHFMPNQDLVWSAQWNFSLVNHIHINNAGYVNDQTYVDDDPRPLFAVVGDSIIEADMVPYPETLQAQLAGALGTQERVYSFAGDGAALSQYLAWAKEAKYRWHAGALAIVVVGNDFDESLATYKITPGFHLYVRDSAAKLALQRFDYTPNPWRELVRYSALARYLVFNLQVQVSVPKWLAAHRAHAEPAPPVPPSSGAPPTAALPAAATAAIEDMQGADAKEVIAAFLRDLTAVAGWRPQEVLFVVDGIRYPERSAEAQSSYFVRMRDYFLKAASSAGFEAIDMDRVFFAEHRRTGAHFEFPTDAHWNGLAHGLAADAVRSSATVARWLRRNRSITSRKAPQSPG